uniref:Uncharacterized protein n=1 Tax=Timema shepardi TaxID=629360 RepID=A0A7R9B4K4_TIMSH|nr:unnamed protein product [Timema shepardi]
MLNSTAEDGEIKVLISVGFACTGIKPYDRERVLNKLPDPVPIAGKSPNSGDQEAVTMPGFTRPITSSTPDRAPDDNNDHDQARTPPMTMENVAIEQIPTGFRPWVVLYGQMKTVMSDDIAEEGLIQELPEPPTNNMGHYQV